MTAKSTTAKGSPTPVPTLSPASVAPPANSSIAIDQDILQQKLADAAIRLHKKDEQAVFSPAMARLMEIQKMADVATTGEQRMKLVMMLEEWERQFLSKR